MLLTRRSRWLSLGSFGCAAALAYVVHAPIQNAPAVKAAQACPAGMMLRDPVKLALEFHSDMTLAQEDALRKRFPQPVCLPAKLPESFTEARALEAARGAGHAMPEGAMRKAVEHKAALKALQTLVPNAVGAWAAYGLGPQVADAAYPDGYNDGIRTSSGRVDNFAYDAVSGRLFAAVSNGGIWMSTAVGGDVGTLGDQWVSIGENMPLLSASAVAWTPARGGRVLALTGDHVQGGNTYVGLGAYWTDDLGANWHHSVGVPDGASASHFAVDPSNPEIVYAATGKGLFRSDDAGQSFVNVVLPVSAECAGVETLGPCQVASFVTDVVIKHPGGSSSVTCDAGGCPVIAAVGYRQGPLPYADGTPQAPGNGLYRSDTGAPGSFERVGLLTGEVQDATGGTIPVGFTPQIRIGRTELGQAIGEDQDHDYLYAIVQDAVLLNDGIPVIDLPTDDKMPAIPLDCTVLPSGDPQFVCGVITAGFGPTALNGIYVSPDFGDTWIRMADDIEITYAGIPSGSTLAAVVALGLGPGAQAWYNEWIKPDPTSSVNGIPNRVLFGLEEIWKNRLPVPMTGLEQTPADFKVIGTYFAGNTCLFLLGNLGLGETPPVCPFRDGLVTDITTTHPDQHDGIYIPDGAGGVWLFVGNDGGVWKQHSTDVATDDFDNTKWGDGANNGFQTLLVYGLGVAKDGTVYYGLQDNASGKIEPDTRRQVRTYIGDGMWAEVDPDDSAIAYVQTPGLSLARTLDGGISNGNIEPGDFAGAAHFLSPFRMDPLSSEHLVAAGTKVAEVFDASTTDGSTWTTVFDLGTNPDTGTAFQSRGPLAVRGDSIYVGYCGPCNITAAGGQFRRGLATNVGGELPPAAGTSDGWHVAAADGLPNRYIYDIAIDPADARTVYVVLGGYSTARWLPEGQYLDTNPNIGTGHVFKSTDAGEHFTDISGDLPSVVSTAIVKRGNQLVVGTDIGAFISSDLNGTLWAPLGDLPSVAINRLVLQPGNDKMLFAGTFGRGVQTYEFQDLPVTPPVVTPPPVVDVPAGPIDSARFGSGALAPWVLLVLFAGFWQRRRSVRASR
ncbi:MAG TPA: hypothetical protein VM074_02170 [Solimonas sp.]|nr:hypothetical protein [Solimonas sp.]